ncbi:hypothetical protein ABTZ59_34540 [Streptomyces sp. NPDC094034]|uniref:hypothetical protein n=1 Tax=Streptomyces sp. NPDC094034 TaxID=3155309 RepID=UPI0033292809
MDSIILCLLAVSGVLSIFLFVARGLLDQTPEVINAWHRVQRAYRGTEPDAGSSADPDT